MVASSNNGMLARANMSGFGGGTFGIGTFMKSMEKGSLLSQYAIMNNKN